MIVVQKFHWTWPPGAKQIDFDEWIDQLPEPERTECKAGMSRQHKMRQESIDCGDMIMTNEGYVWKDKETADKGKGIDEVWEKYWLRWQTETGVTFSMTFEEQ